uniref:Uncharacterized protein n=1 Tax=Eutreptiella gymnastica TaxID=73025 RepID=A0A7S1HU68_9EUGL
MEENAARTPSSSSSLLSSSWAWEPDSVDISAADEVLCAASGELPIDPNPIEGVAGAGVGPAGPDSAPSPSPVLSGASPSDEVNPREASDTATGMGAGCPSSARVSPTKWELLDVENRDSVRVSAPGIPRGKGRTPKLVLGLS